MTTTPTPEQRYLAEAAKAAPVIEKLKTHASPKTRSEAAAASEALGKLAELANGVVGDKDELSQACKAVKDGLGSAVADAFSTRKMTDANSLDSLRQNYIKALAALIAQHDIPMPAERSRFSR